MPDEAIRTDAACREYVMGRGSVFAVNGVSVRIGRGEFVALLGASGSGKSTLLNMIAGLDRATAGSVTVEGTDLDKLSRNALSEYRLRTVGMVFQSFNLIGTMDLLQNVELPMRFAEVDRKKRADLGRKALERVGLGERLRHRPKELSGGEQQRVAIARALINEPRILLADEPTGNLDSKTGTEIMRMLQDLNGARSMTIVMVTHEQALARRYASRLLTMSDGKMIGDEPNQPESRGAGAGRPPAEAALS